MSACVFSSRWLLLPSILLFYRDVFVCVSFFLFSLLFGPVCEIFLSLLSSMAFSLRFIFLSFFVSTLKFPVFLFRAYIPLSLFLV